MPGLLQLICTTIALVLLHQGVAAEEVPSPTAEVSLLNGLLSINASGAPLREVLVQIGKAGGIDVVLEGDLSSPVRGSFTGVTLSEGIRLIAGHHSLVMIYESDDGGTFEGRRVVKRILVFAAEDRGEDEAVLQSGTRTPPSGSRGIIDYLLTEELHYPDRASGKDLLRQLNRFDEATTVRILGRILSRDEDFGTRIEAAEELSKIGSDSAVAALAEALGDSTPSLRSRVVECIGKAKSDSAVQILGQAVVADPAPQVRRSAARSLAGRGTEASKAFLASVEEDPDPEVREIARRALQGVTALPPP